MRTTLSTFVKYAAVTGSYSMCCQFWCVCVCILFVQLFVSCGEVSLLAVVSIGTVFYLPVRWRLMSKPTCL